MPSSPVARVYAEALFGIARERSVVDETGEELAQLLALVEAEEEIYLFLTSPVLDAGEKITLLRRALEGRASELVADFLSLLLRKRRFPVLPEIVAVYGDLADDLAGRTRATIRTAVPLAPELREEIETSLREGLGRQVILTPEVAEDMLGGAVVAIGDRVYDGSLATRLRQFRKQIMRSGGYEDQG
jgi:F-type H+-transporting ATPase subunit delta